MKIHHYRENSVLECTRDIESISCVTEKTQPTIQFSESTVRHKRVMYTRVTTVLTRSEERHKFNRRSRVARKRCHIFQSKDIECQTEYFCSVYRFLVCADTSG